MNKVYRKYNTGRLLAIHERKGVFTDSSGATRQSSWLAEFEDCMVPVSPELGKSLMFSIGEEVKAVSPGFMMDAIMLKAKLEQHPYVNEASGTIIAVEMGQVPRIVFDDCSVLVTCDVAARLRDGGNVHIMRVSWSDDMQKMYDAIWGLSMTARAIGRAHVADGYELVLDWLRSVRANHIVVERI